MTDWSGKILYRYTDFYELEGILEKKEMWLSNVRTMNDKTEMHHFMNGLKKAVKIDCLDKEDEVESLFDTQLSRLKSEQAYSLSLSMHGDDAGQWERYGNNGMGVCIAFDAEILSVIAKESNAVLQKVLYRDDLSKHAIKQDITYYINTGNMLNNISGIEGVFENAWASSAAFKHSSFEGEGEVRVCLLALWASAYKYDIRYKVENWGIREYYPLKFFDDDGESLKKGLIKKIMVGPRTLFPEGVLERYLIRYGLDEKLADYSKCPLR